MGFLNCGVPIFPNALLLKMLAQVKHPIRLSQSHTTAEGSLRFLYIPFYSEPADMEKSDLPNFRLFLCLRISKHLRKNSFLKNAPLFLLIEWPFLAFREFDSPDQIPVLTALNREAQLVG